MGDGDTTSVGQDKFKGLTLDLVGVGRVQLTEVVSQNNETSVYLADHPGIVVKMFDLDCGKSDEVSYAPYVAFQLECENFQDIDSLEPLRRCVPAYYGAKIDFDRKYAYIAMERLRGENLIHWCGTATFEDLSQWTEQLRATIYSTLSVLTRFHQQGIFLIDFKPDNVLRLTEGGIKFVDLGAFFTPRHSREAEKYIYSATPDYAELVIDTSNVQAGQPLNEASDIFAAGVALFEMTAGRSRLAIAAETGDQFLAWPELYRFRDSQIRDVWHAFPHLRDVLPTVESQLHDRQLLFAEAWPLIKNFLAHEVADWETLPEAGRQQLILQTGTELIASQLPWKLDWLAQAIAHATTLRSFRLKTVAELMRLIAQPIDQGVQQELRERNSLIRYLEDQGLPTHFLARLNAWEVKTCESTGGWSVLLPTVQEELAGLASFTCLRRVHQAPNGDSFYAIVSDTEADSVNGQPLTVAHLGHDHAAWLAG